MAIVGNGDNSYDINDAVMQRLEMILSQAGTDDPKGLAAAVVAAAHDPDYNSKMMSAVKSGAWPAIIPALSQQMKSPPQQPQTPNMQQAAMQPMQPQPTPQMGSLAQMPRPMFA